jgi:KUP system potassium uptake protein
MADLETAQRIQFGEGIHPVKTATSKVYNKDPSFSEKNGFDIEDRAIQIANADLNQKKKQVSDSIPNIWKAYG